MKQHHAVLLGSGASILVLLMLSFHRSALYDHEMAASRKMAELQRTIDTMSKERSQEFSRLTALEHSLGRLLQETMTVPRPEVSDIDIKEKEMEEIQVLKPAMMPAVVPAAMPAAVPAAVPAAEEVKIPTNTKVANPTREQMRLRKKLEAEAKKKAELALLQAQVSADLENQQKRGYDLSRRLTALHVPTLPPLVLSKSDLQGKSTLQIGRGLRDIYIEKNAQILFCTIEKVASSELKKLLFRMSGDPRWRDEPWFKGQLPKMKDMNVQDATTIMNSPAWTKMTFLRHPYERLVSCYKDKFGRDNRLYSVKMTGNRSTHMLSFREFVDLISAPESPHQNQHWRPQSMFCGFEKFLSLYNFVGSFNHLQEHAKVFLQGTDIWDTFGAHGWGEHNGSMFERNVAMHRTSTGAVSGRIKIDEARAKQSYDELLPPGSQIRKKAFSYYRKDFEMFAKITTPPFDASRYQLELAREIAAGPPTEPWPRKIKPYYPIRQKRRRRRI